MSGKNSKELGVEELGGKRHSVGYVISKEFIRVIRSIPLVAYLEERATRNLNKDLSGLAALRDDKVNILNCRSG
jgi:hypothetical protein